jgi:hypothetical protein
MVPDIFNGKMLQAVQRLKIVMRLPAKRGHDLRRCAVTGRKFLPLPAKKCHWFKNADISARY